MKNEQNNLRFVWLALATVLSLFVGGRWSIPAAAWLAPIFLIRFYRDSDKGGRAFLWMWLTGAGSAILIWHGATALRYVHPIAEPLMFALIAPITLTPYVIDRFYDRRWPQDGQKPFWLTLVFPIGLTAIDYFSASGSPFGTFGAAAYSQAGFTSFMQLSTLTGLYGIPFILSWFASVVNYAWEKGFAWGEIKRGAIVFGAIMTLVFVFGFSRTALAKPAVQEVPIGGFSLPNEGLDPLFDLINAGEADAFRQLSSDLHGKQLAKIRSMAKAGAKIVTLQEGAGIGYQSEVEQLLLDASQVAREEEIYIVLPTGTLSETGEDLMHNVVHIIDPNGEIVLEHYKFGGTQFEGSVTGSGEMQTVETPYGTISAIICWDADFPENIKQAGEKKVDLLFVPSNDWFEIRDIHPAMATFRSVENGVPIFRQTGNGTSVVTDAYGRTLNRIDMFEEEPAEWGAEQIVTTQIGSVDTLYPAVGDKFGLAMFIAFLGLIVFAWLSWFVNRKSG